MDRSCWFCHVPFDKRQSRHNLFSDKLNIQCMIEEIIGFNIWNASGTNDQSLCRTCFNNVVKMHKIQPMIKKWRTCLQFLAAPNTPKKKNAEKKRILSPSVRRTPENFLKKKTKKSEKVGRKFQEA